MSADGTQVIFIFFSGTIICLMFVAAAFAFVFLYQNKKIKHEQDLRKKEEENQANILRAIIQGQENEQRRLAAELHDGIAVEIASINSFLHHLKPILAVSETGTKSIGSILELMKELYDNTRKISHGLMPANIERIGLISALNDFTQQLNAGGNIPVKLNIHGEYNRLPVNNELLVYRIVQELIQNALKYSEATQILLNVECSEGKLKVEVADNGRGFDMNDSNRKSGIGLKNIEARVKLLSGNFLIESVVNKGTKAILVV